MPNKKAAIKNLRQNAKRHMRNIAQVSEIRTFIKNTRALITKGNRADADTMLKKLESKLHKAVKTKVIKKGHASRHISRLRTIWAKLA